MYKNIFSQSEGIKFILFLIHSGIEVNFNMMHVKYDLIYHSIHFYRWDSLCYLTEVKKKKIIIKVHVFSIYT